MFEEHRSAMFDIYNKARNFLIHDPQPLVELEKAISLNIQNIISTNYSQLEKNYNEASFLFPFWQNYPPIERGRQPRGDQFPWIEVGEHSIGSAIARYLAERFEIREIGLPSGSDIRLLITSDEIKKLLAPIATHVMLFIDIKSVGPRDDFNHAVLSPYQVSGDGLWISKEVGIMNSIINASGRRVAMEFHCALPPLYVLSDKTVAPLITIFIKPVYSMLSLIGSPFKNRDDSDQEDKAKIEVPDSISGSQISEQVISFQKGQPLSRITNITVPNGLLLTQNPNYLKDYPNLLFPGKDDQKKNVGKKRARVSFKLLEEINSWRVKTISS